MQFDFISQENDEIIQKATALLTLCKNTHSAYFSGNLLQKRTLLKMITSHFGVFLKILELLKFNQGKKKEPLKALFLKMVGV